MKERPQRPANGGGKGCERLKMMAKPILGSEEADGETEPEGEQPGNNQTLYLNNPGKDWLKELKGLQREEGGIREETSDFGKAQSYRSSQGTKHFMNCLVA